jgi:hypothetical protein
MVLAVEMALPLEGVEPAFKARFRSSLAKQLKFMWGRRVYKVNSQRAPVMSIPHQDSEEVVVEELSSLILRFPNLSP